MKSKKTPYKEKFYLTILNFLKQDFNPAKICKELNISKQNLNYYLRQLKNLGYIEKKGYGVWEVKISTKDTKLTIPKSVRGHAFIWSVKIPKEIKGWNLRREILTKAKIHYKKIGLKDTPRITINNKKIWLGNKRITIYENKSFYGENAIQSRKYAVITLIETLKKLESKLGINLRPYTFKPAREHYGLVKNDLALQCNRSGEKIYVRDDLEGLWLWIDDSLSLSELETGGKKAMPRNLQVQGWFNDHKKHDFEVTPSFVLHAIKRNAENLDNYAVHLKAHVESVQILGKDVEKLTEIIGELNKIIGKLK